MTIVSHQSFAKSIQQPIGQVVAIEWKRQSPPPHEFLVIACPEEDGGFSAFAAHIPGVITQGESVEEVKANISEAFLAVLESCRQLGKPLPYSYQSVVEMSEGCQRLWVTVNV